MGINPVLVWFLIGLVLVLMEFFAPGVILVFFGVGAWVAMTTTWLGWTESLGAQVVVFIVSSLLLLFALRHWIRSRFHGHISDEQSPEVNLDEFSGQLVKVTREIVPGKTDGKVEYKGAEWSAMSDAGFNVGEQARIVSVDGITLRVRKPD
jgi:membrane protein implicated in regulation of membrane protease activity